MEFKFVNKRNIAPATKNHELKLNDMLEVVEEDGVYYRIYLNNLEYYVELPADNIMLIELKTHTWTLDNTERNSKLVKSGKDNIYLSDVLERYGYDRSDYEVIPLKYSGIDKETYDKKRNEFKQAS